MDSSPVTHMPFQVHSNKWTGKTQNDTTEEQVVAILRRAEEETRSKMARLSQELEEFRTRCHKLETRNLFLTRSIIDNKKKLTSEVQDLEAKLRIAREEASRNKAKLESTEAQVSTLLSEKQQNSDERAALVQHVLGLEVACHQFRSRAV